MRRLTWIILSLFLLAGCGRRVERQYAQALREAAAGRDVRAQTLLEKVIRSRPGSEANAPVYNHLGIILVRLGRLEEAMEAFEESRRLNPDFLAPIVNLGLLLLEGGEDFRSMVTMREAAMTDASDPRPLEFLASMQRYAGDWDKAAETLAAAATRAPASPRVRTAQGVVLARSGRGEEAVKHWQEALEREPEYAAALYNLAMYHETYLDLPDMASGYYRLFLEAGGEGVRAERAQRILADAVSAAPPEEPTPAAPDVATEEEEPEAADPLAAARRAFERSQVTRALNYYLLAAAEAGREQHTERRESILREAALRCFDQARAHMAHGQFLLEQDRPSEALAAFKRAVVLEPNIARMHYALARAALAAEEQDAALVALRKTIELDPRHADALWDLILLLEGPLRRQDRAAPKLRLFLERFAEDTRAVEARRRLDTVTEPPAPPEDRRRPAASPPAGREERPSAIEFRRPATRRTDLAVQAFNRGVAHQRRGDRDGAVYYYIRSLEHDDTFAAAFYNLGAIYREQGHLDLAQEAYRRGLEHQPGHADARYNLALLHWEKENYEEAAREARRVAGEVEEHAQAHLLLGLLYADHLDRPDLARDHYRAFLRLAPDAPSAHGVRRWLEANRS